MLGSWKRYWEFWSLVFEPAFAVSSFDHQALGISDTLEKTGEGTCRHSFLF